MHKRILLFFLLPICLNAAQRSVEIQIEPPKPQPQIVFVPVPMDFINTSQMPIALSSFGSEPCQQQPSVPSASTTNNQIATIKPPSNASHWFFYFMRILCNFGKIFVDVHNRPKLKENITDFLNTVDTMAQELSTRSLNRKQRELEIMRLMRQLEILAAQLPEPIIA